MDEYTIPQLKEMLRVLGLKTSGNKAELCSRVDSSLSERDMTIENLLALVAQNNDSREEAGAEGVGCAHDPEGGQVVAEVVPGVAVSRHLPENHSADSEQTNVRRVRSHSVESNGAASCVSGSSRASSTVSTRERRREAAVKRAKLKARNENARELLDLEMKRRKLRMEAEEAEAAAEEEMWERFEAIDLQTVGRFETPLAQLHRDVGAAPKHPVQSGNSRVDSNDTQYSVRIPRSAQLDSVQNGTVRSNKQDEPPLRDVFNCRGHASEVEGNANVALQELVRSTERARLPERKIETFCGDIEKYSLFRSAFAGSVGAASLTDREKLHYLYQFTGDMPRELVGTCLYMGDVEGYGRAWTLLDKRYGDPQQIGMSHISRVLSFPEIGRDDARALDDFTIALTMASNAVSRVPYGRNELESPKTIRELVMKLPFALRDRWRHKAHSISERESGNVTFSDFLKFVENEAAVANHPLYGKAAMTGQLDARVKETRHARRTLIGSIQEVERCVHCEGEHDVVNCFRFKRLTRDDKLNSLRSKGLCFKCLKGKHFARDCAEPVTCTDCGAQHPTLLHWDRRFVRFGDVVERNNGSMGGTSEVSDARPLVSRLNQRDGDGHRSWLQGSGGTSVYRSTRSSSSVGGRGQTINPGSGTNGGNPSRIQPASNVGSEESAGVSLSAAVDFAGGGMAILPVQVRTIEGLWIKTSALLDGGSSITLCNRRLLEKMGLSTDSSVTGRSAVTLGGEVKLDGGIYEGWSMRGANCWEQIELPPVYGVRSLPVDGGDAIQQKDIDAWPHLEEVFLGEVGDVDMIIGANSPAAMEPLKIVPAPSKGDPFAVLTRIGWVVYGIDSIGLNKPIGRIGMKEAELTRLVSSAFNCGFEDAGEVGRGYSVDDRKWLYIVNSGIRQVEGKFEIPLPFRDENVCLPRTREAAVGRAESLRRKLKKEGGLAEYSQKISVMVTEGHAEKILDGHTSNKNWYIPHFRVLQQSKPGKIRIVFDCAAKIGGVSLNDLLLQGPNMGNELLDVLMRFREGRYGYMADIEAMFYQVLVPERQRDYLRFIWFDGEDGGGPIVEYRMRVHLFGACSSPSVATYALRRLTDRVDFPASIKSTILRNFYVDDCLLASNSLTELRDLSMGVSDLCLSGGFKLGKCVATSSVKEFLNASDGHFLTVGSHVKALGVTWNLEEDSLGPTCTWSGLPTNRRELLSLIASVYDPLGVVAPVVTKGRFILQRSFRRGTPEGWHEGFDDHTLNEIGSWVAELRKVLGSSVPRSLWVTESPVLEWQLHVFADASGMGHGAVAYARVKSESTVRCVFLGGKSRVNPLKDMSIPRLELVAALLAAKIKTRILDVLRITFSDVHMWTDSAAVLKYLRNEKDRFNVFVANRITLIRDMTSVSDWRYVDSSLNPADEASRGHVTRRWYNGPSFLLDAESKWPQEQNCNMESVQLEVRTDKVLTLRRALVCSGATDDLIAYFSSWKKLKTAVAYFLIFIEWLKKGKRGDLSVWRLSVSWIALAERSIVGYVQSKHFASEIRLLKEGRSLGRGSRLWSLDPFLEKDTLRVGGRLRRAEGLDFDGKHPSILPGTEPLTELLILHHHERLGHLGTDVVLCAIRERYWVLKGTSTVRRVLRRCVVCLKVRGQRMQQKMADLPRERLVPGMAAFENSGVDCFGPFTVRVGRKRVKRYGVVFTCLAMRAIHLEVCADLSSGSFINALRRFWARRGFVRSFVSDNGTNFVGARRELLNALSAESIRRASLDREIEWRFNPPGASHFGGAWERMIRTVRKVLEASMGGQVLTDDGLNTLFCEVEAAVNSRPLSVVSSDVGDLDVLTPNKLLTMRTAAFSWDSNERDCYSRQYWRQVQFLANQFWRRWCKEYRAMLHERRKWTRPRKDLQIGDIVLIIDENEARCHWPLGKVTEVIRSSDGHVRSGSVFARGKTFRRPISKMVRLVEGEDMD